MKQLPEPQITQEEAIQLVESGWWKTRTPIQIVEFQLFQDRLCMDFGDFHAAVEKVLGYPVWTHQFAYSDALRAEFLKLYELRPMATILAEVRQ